MLFSQARTFINHAVVALISILKPAADKTIQIVETKRRSPCCELAVHSRGVNDITWLHSDLEHPIIVSASDDCTLKVVDVATV